MRIKDGLGEVKLSEDHSIRILEAARAVPRDHLLLALQLERGLRIGAVVGHPPKTVTYWVGKEEKRHKVTKTYSQPGLKKEDVQEEGIVTHLKGGDIRVLYPGAQLLQELKDWAVHVKPGERLIPLTEEQGNNILRKWAKIAGIPNWQRLHNHRSRHHYGTQWARRTGRDAWKLKSLMTHKDLRSTTVYVDDLTPEEERELVDSAPTH